MGGGLGGGSSDAAAALRLANEIWELGLDRKQLLALAPELGSDVAFFLFQSTAFAEGRGEILSPAPKPYAFHVVVATPPFQVETARAYRGLGPLAGSRWNGFKARYAAESQNPSLYSGLHNDFEEPMERLFPEIRTLRESLASFGPEKAMLTGSGSSLFALFRDPGNAKACLEAVAPRCRFSAMTRFLF
jgi:4-diphosphocytidyl-2-C-methyl-D-erythritol kinase